MKIVYICGPFRSETHWGIVQNVRRAEALALEAWKLGCAVFCPHLNSANFQGAAPDSLWLEGDLAILERCDAVLCTPDWETSSGARIEVALANDLGKPVFFALADLAGWLRASAIVGAA